MAGQVFPTKSNLISTRKSLDLAKLGYDLLDRKRNILVREMMLMIDKANEVQNRIDSTYTKAYASLQRANVTLGMCSSFAQAVPVDQSLAVDFRSVMGVELPMVSIGETKEDIYYGLHSTNSMLDDAYRCFDEVKHLTAELAEIENGVYRLRRRSKNAEARKRIAQHHDPQFEATIKFITEALEEKEREDFSRLKVIKSQKQ